MFKVFFVVLSFYFVDQACTACYRKPQGATGDRSPVDENYQIMIDGNPATYLPGQQYNISLSSANGLKFISFTLLVEAESPNTLLSTTALGAESILGRFEIINSAETKFNTLCGNMIESSNTNAKNRIDVAWIAPTDGQSGCVLFKAAILQHRNVWFIDDGFLTKRLCPEEIDDINSQTPPVNPCCACDEAKYEIVLERKWMRNTHAKDFPSEAWRTRLGEVIGASHSLDFRFWEYGGRASQGLQELAEHGATKTLEKEIKEQTGTGYIRTIIKAPGIMYRPNVMGKTLATVRVGPNHHVISLVTKIDPSPDWILGVAGLELCLTNCTWIETKILNLYPWDVGTDAGPSYMSPDQVQHPPDVIRRITSTFPSDYRSPFFDETGAPMKPLATLHITRKRTYERECDFEDIGPMECSTHPWSNWSDCNAKCGAGTQYRTRSYKDVKVAENFNCKVVLRQNQNCIGTQCGVQQGANLPGAECELTMWSAWTECSKKCGRGYQTRTRDYTNPYAKEKCQAGVVVELQQTRPCNGENCGGNIHTSVYDVNGNDRFQANYDLEDQQSNKFLDKQFERKAFNKTFEGPIWQNRDIEKELNKFDTMHFNTDNNDFGNPTRQSNNNYKNDEQEAVSVNNIYGNEKLVGKGQLPNQERHNQNAYGDVEANFNDNKDYRGHRNRQQLSPALRPTEKYGLESYIPNSNAPRTSNTANTFNRNFGPYGFKTIEAETEEQETDNFCLQKPFASPDKCSKKRLIVLNYWFYDADDGECKLFTADNCDENKNKFFSMERCLETCSQTMNYQQETLSNTRKGYGNTLYRSRWN